MITAMSGRFILATAFLVAGGVALLFSFAQIGWQLCKDACWTDRWTARRLRS
jgi:hypothetical protein